MEEYLPKLYAITKEKPVMCGIYVWDYSVLGGRPMDISLFKKQLSRYFDMLKSKEIKGVIVCSSTLGDAELETNKIVRQYIKEHGDTEI